MNRKAIFATTAFLVLSTAALFNSTKTIATPGQWSTNGSVIYYNDGSIGLGTNAPTSMLDITGNNSAVATTTLQLGTIPGRQWAFYNHKYADSARGDYALTLGQPSYSDCTACKGDLSFKPGRNSVFSQGNVGIGKQNPTEKLEVNGKIRAKEIIVTTSGWPDYVFGDNYKLMSLSEIEEYINQNKHLPGVTSAEEIESSGLSMGEMQKKQMEKIEELTLHLIEKEKEIDSLEERVERLERTRY